ncbi:MAG: two pore domain potassium channel family protein [Pirellulales bacterium]|nr:two pore domain potassium channel family protein [Pirellulales bacterium]
MLEQILYALALTSVTVTCHAAGSVYLVIPATGVWKPAKTSSAASRPVWTLIRLVSLLLVLHLLEMSVWAAAYAAGGVLPDFETAFYFSMTSYSTLGFGDVIPPVSWRLLGPIEAVVGVLMLGWSTSIIVAVVQRMYNSRLPNAPGATDRGATPLAPGE